MYNPTNISVNNIYNALIIATYKIYLLKKIIIVKKIASLVNLKPKIYITTTSTVNLLYLVTF